MFEHRKLQDLTEYFIDLNKRRDQGVFFYRITGYSNETGAFIRRFYETARLTGVIIEGGIPNPDEKNLQYYYEMMGTEFQFSPGFISSSLKKWLPRMNEMQRRFVSDSIYDTLDLMRKQGKNENMLRNAYIKFMCWLYYKFERIVNKLGSNTVPKILYEGDVSNYELKLLSILSKSGCDILLLQYNGDSGYLKLDHRSELSTLFSKPDLLQFPEFFSLQWIKTEIQQDLKRQALYGSIPQFTNCTNAWIEGSGFSDVLKDSAVRGNDPHLYYNCFFRINGVEDRLTYMNDWYQFYLQMKNKKRNIVVVNREILRPSMEEIAVINRKNYTSTETMIVDLSQNIQYAANPELQKLNRKLFIDILLEADKMAGSSLNQMTNKAVYLLCWMKRYQNDLFRNWKYPETACFIYAGRCRDVNEASFIQLLSRLPVDVLILNSDRQQKCCLADTFLFEINYSDTAKTERFPCDGAAVQVGTPAYHAERELDTLLYQDTGIYRNQQCSKASSVVLKTMYEEIAILWNQELKYRPSFSVVENVVNIPVIFAKISGVKEGNVSQYWASIKRLMNEDTFYIRHTPAGGAPIPNPVRQFAASFLKNGRLLRDHIKSHQVYPYGVLREDMQDHLLDKIQMMLDQRLIRGTFENGTEYTVIAAALNMSKDMIRKIQQFDFTKKNPKLIYINTSEIIMSLEDSIVAAFLSLVGFDVMFFVPTGYQSVENHYSKPIVEEHQTGRYLYDLTVPDFDNVPLNYRDLLRQKIFKRGN
ncbi:MAG: YceG family protein [Lachnospiraceae bacterium]